MSVVCQLLCFVVITSVRFCCSIIEPSFQDFSIYRLFWLGIMWNFFVITSCFKRYAILYGIVFPGMRMPDWSIRPETFKSRHTVFSIWPKIILKWCIGTIYLFTLSQVQYIKFGVQYWPRKLPDNFFLNGIEF